MNKFSSTIFRFIAENKPMIKYLVECYGIGYTAEQLNTSNLNNDKITKTELGYIMSYIKEEVVREYEPFKLTLPRPADGQSVINYIKQHSEVVVKYYNIMRGIDTTNDINKLVGKLSYGKLLTLIKYIKETND